MNTSNMSEVLSVKNLCASYGKKQIIKNLSFDLAKGELICLCGPNGSGKSTLLSSIAGIKTGSLSEKDILHREILYFLILVKNRILGV